MIRSVLMMFRAYRDALTLIEEQQRYINALWSDADVPLASLNDGAQGTRNARILALLPKVRG